LSASSSDLEMTRQDYVLERLSVALIWGVAIWLTVLLFWNSWQADMSAIYMAAKSVHSGQEHLLYLSPPHFFGGPASAEWNRQLQEIAGEGAFALPYIYPPLWAVALAPIAGSVSPQGFFNAVALLNATLLVVGALLAFRIAQPVRISVPVWMVMSLGLAVLCTPVHLALWLGQPQILVTVVCLWAVDRDRAGAALTAGGLIGLAASIKILPIAFVVLFVLDRNWRAFGASALTGLALLGLSIALAGWPMHEAFFAQLMKASDHLILTDIVLGLEAILLLLIQPEPVERVLHFAIYEGLGWVSGFAILGLGVSIFAIWLRQDRLSFYGRLFAFWALFVFFGPLAWAHYLLGLILLLPAVLERGRMAALCGCAAGLALSHPVAQAAKTIGDGVSLPILLGSGALLLIAAAGFSMGTRD